MMKCENSVWLGLLLLGFLLGTLPLAAEPGSSPTPAQAKKAAKGAHLMAAKAPGYWRDHGRPLIIAHRGARSIAPENTLPAFKIAVERCGADLLELDVQPSKEGVPMVLHDESLERTTDVKTRFPDRAPFYTVLFTQAEIESLDAGSWFVAQDPFKQIREGKVPAADIAEFKSGNIRIPTLKAALQLVKELNQGVNIEIKNFPAYYPGFTSEVVKVTRESGAAHLVLFSSFDHEVLAQLGKIAPEIPRAALCDQPVYPLGPYVKDLLKCVVWNPGTDVMGFNSFDYFHFKKLRGDLVDQAQRAGLAVYVWTINSPEDLERLINLCVDGIFTDFPQRLRDLLPRKR